MPQSDRQGPRVGLFATCLVDIFRPTVGFAAAKLLEDAGCMVEVPSQTCCGQPAYNSGDREDAKSVAKTMIAAFEPFDYVVAPSGSCAATISKHYPELFKGEGDWERRAGALAGKTYELVSFLTDVLKVQAVEAACEASATYHDSCSGLRELGVQRQPRTLLGGVQGLELREMAYPEVCCGFGGTFCVKYPDISNVMVGRKTEDIAATEADMVLAGDLGCLMNIAGKLKREGKPVKARHVAEVLAGMTDEPAIGEGEEA